MPKIDIKVKEKDGTEYECHAKGFFLLGLSFTNNPKPKIVEWIKKYETKK